LLNRAGVEIDTTLFPVLMLVGMHNKIGIVELANQLGRDHSTVSRQVGRLTSAKLIVSDISKVDKRSKEIKLSDEGKVIVAAVVKARRKLMSEVLADWNDRSLGELQSNLSKLADALDQTIITD
jgi:DNA-binding MarR family transcriptional regulator